MHSNQHALEIDFTLPKPLSTDRSLEWFTLVLVYLDNQNVSYLLRRTRIAIAINTRETTMTVTARPAIAPGESLSEFSTNIIKTQSACYRYVKK